MAINRPYRSPADLPPVVPVFPLPCALLLPRAELPLNIFEPRYLEMIDHAIRGERLIGMVQPTEDGESGRGKLFPIGCAGRITGFLETGDGRYQITLSGVARFRVGAEQEERLPFRTVAADFSPFASDLYHRDEDDAGVNREALFDALKGYATRHSLNVDWDSVRKAPSEALVNALAMMSPFGVGEKQALLEAPTVSQRGHRVHLVEFELGAMRDQRPDRVEDRIDRPISRRLHGLSHAVDVHRQRRRLRAVGARDDR